MTPLRRRALARLALTEAEVERLFDTSDRRPDILDDFERLCTSHERLRAELQGAEILLDDLRREVAAVVAELEAGAGCSDVWAACLARLRGMLPNEEGRSNP